MKLLDSNEDLQSISGIFHTKFDKNNRISKIWFLRQVSMSIL